MKNCFKEFIENEDYGVSFYIENIHDTLKLKNFNLKKYYDLFILENYFEELQVHGFQKITQITSVSTEHTLLLKEKIRKRIKELVKVRICLLNKIKNFEPTLKFITQNKLKKEEDFILNPFCNVLNTQKNVTDEINKQISFLI